MRTRSHTQDSAQVAIARSCISILQLLLNLLDGMSFKNVAFWFVGVWVYEIDMVDRKESLRIK